MVYVSFTVAYIKPMIAFNIENDKVTLRVGSVENSRMRVATSFVINGEGTPGHLFCF